MNGCLMPDASIFCVPAMKRRSATSAVYGQAIPTPVGVDFYHLDANLNLQISGGVIGDMRR